MVGGITVNLDGSSSFDPDGTIASYAWTRVSGTSVVLTGANTATPSFAAPTSPTTLVFRLTVTDNDGDTDTDNVTISVGAVPNQSPIADAGSSQSVLTGVEVNLDGSGSSDPDGTIASYSWTRISGTSISLIGGNTSTPSFIAPDQDATIVLRLTVTDNDGATDTDDVTITVVAVTSGMVTIVVPNSGWDSGGNRWRWNNFSGTSPTSAWGPAYRLTAKLLCTLLS